MYPGARHQSEHAYHPSNEKMLQSSSLVQPRPSKGASECEALFDSFTMDAHHASIVLGTVTQDFDYARFKEEASTDKIAGKSTWELLQLSST